MMTIRLEIMTIRLELNRIKQSSYVFIMGNKKPKQLNKKQK